MKGGLGTTLGIGCAGGALFGVRQIVLIVFNQGHLVASGRDLLALSAHALAL
jgi:hypothetical protein